MPNYGDPQYWEDRYKGSKGKLFEWLEDFDAIEGLFLSLLDQIPGLDKSSDGWQSNVKILNLGCGNSTLAEELYDRGFKSVYNNDISAHVIQQMSERNAEGRPELQWTCMDVRDMTYDSNFFDIIIDKSTIDALLCGEDAYLNTALMLKECQRVMRVGGFYMGISYGNPEGRKLHYERCHLKFESSIFEIPPKDPKNSMHYVYVNKKLEGADENCEINWPKVPIEIYEEEKKMALEHGLNV